MSATTNGTGVAGSAKCRINYVRNGVGDRVTVTSPTGNSVFIDIAKAPRSWATFAKEDQMLLHKLMSFNLGANGAGQHEHVLSYEEMNSLKRIAQQAKPKMQLHLLEYDITAESEMENPSGVLRRRGVRTTLSGWVVPTAQMPWTLLNELREAGCRVRHHPYADEGFDAILAEVIEALQKQIAEAAESVKESLANKGQKAEEAMAQEQTSKELQNTARTYIYGCRGSIRDKKRLLADLEVAAGLFGIDQNLLPLRTARETVNALEIAHQRQAALYARMAGIVVKTRMGKAAKNSDVPPEVLADYIEEELGEDMSEARAAFTHV